MCNTGTKIGVGSFYQDGVIGRISTVENTRAQIEANIQQAGRTAHLCTPNAGNAHGVGRQHIVRGSTQYAAVIAGKKEIAICGKRGERIFFFNREHRTSGDALRFSLIKRTGIIPADAGDAITIRCVHSGIPNHIAVSGSIVCCDGLIDRNAILHREVALDVAQLRSRQRARVD